MVNVILSRIELLADLHTTAKEKEIVRHVGVLQDEAIRRDAQLTLELDILVYNMRQRYKARRVKEAAYVWLHLLHFDQTYIDLHSDEQKDYRVREYFDPLLVACDNDKKILLSAYTQMLDRYFPIMREDRVWAPKLIKVPFKPRRKSDQRTTTYTIVHSWSLKKV